MNEPKTLIAYPTYDFSERDIPIVPGYVQRDWMNNLGSGNPNRCLPLTMANHNGWFLLSPASFTVRWNGEPHPKNLTIQYDEADTAEDEQESRKPRRIASSWFGGGIVTWDVGYLFRTPPGYNLMVRGPANWIKGGIQALEGLVESDWIEATFTMNWKVTIPNMDIRFERGEPFCMITPIPRGDIESFEPTVQPLKKGSRLYESLKYFSRSRQLTVIATQRARRKAEGEVPHVAVHELAYMRGQSSDGKTVFPDHQTRLEIKPFKHVSPNTEK